MQVFSARTFWLPVLLSTLVAAFFGAVLARRGRALERMLSDRALLEARLARLEAENDLLRAERDELLSSPGAIERAARKEYGLTAPGEEVVDFDARPPVLRVDPARRTALSPAEKVLTWPGLSLAVPAVVFLATSVLCVALNLAGARRTPEPR